MNTGIYFQVKIWKNIRESKSSTLREKQDVKQIQGLLTYSNKVVHIGKVTKKPKSLDVRRFTFLLPSPL